MRRLFLPTASRMLFYIVPAACLCLKSMGIAELLDGSILLDASCVFTPLLTETAPQF
jgi:hypothetical protein